MEQFDNYVRTLNDEQRGIFTAILSIINAVFTTGTSKLYHGAPVWFLDDNPLFGLSSKKAGLELLFWSGQDFQEPGLTPLGSFKAAGKIHVASTDVDAHKITTWIGESLRIQYDYRNLRKNNGILRLIP